MNQAARRIAGAGLALMMTALSGHAQQADTEKEKPSVMSRTQRADLMQTAPTQTFYLKNCSEPNDANEILTALRLILDPAVKLFLVPKDNAIVMRALPDDLALATKLIGELDRPRRTFRLTYAVTDFDGTKRLGTRHFVMVVADGQRATMKSGEKVPVVTGSYDTDNKTAQTQMTYLDVGWNFDSTLNGNAGGAQLKVKAERSVVAEAKPGPAPTPDPSIRQSILEGVTSLTLGKPLVVGSMEVPDSTQHVEIEATLELVP